MNVFTWIFLGLLAGAITKLLFPNHQAGRTFLGTVLLGVIGAIIGGCFGLILSTGTLAVLASTLSSPGVVFAILGASFAISAWGVATIINSQR